MEELKKGNEGLVGQTINLGRATQAVIANKMRLHVSLHWAGPAYPAVVSRDGLAREKEERKTMLPAQKGPAVHGGGPH